MNPAALRSLRLQEQLLFRLPVVPLFAGKKVVKVLRGNMDSFPAGFPAPQALDRLFCSVGDLIAIRRHAVAKNRRRTARDLSQRTCLDVKRIEFSLLTRGFS